MRNCFVVVVGCLERSRGNRKQGTSRWLANLGANWDHVRGGEGRAESAPGRGASLRLRASVDDVSYSVSIVAWTSCH